MSHRRFHDPSHHAPFAFSKETDEQITWWEQKYPSERRASAVIPALWITQKQNAGWLSEPALRAVADDLAARAASRAPDAPDAPAVDGRSRPRWWRR